MVLLLTLLSVPVFAQPDTTPTRDNNLAMGNPSGALTLTSDSNNYLLVKSQYALSYNNSKGMANWVSWHLSPAWKGAAARCNCFTQDASLPAGYFLASTANYTSTGFDRGHLCPSDDRDGSDTDNAITFKMSNIAPQAPYLNEQTWAYLEDYCRTLLNQGKELYITAGGYGTGGSGSLGGLTNNINGGSINVPAYFWKIIVVLDVDSNDVSRITTSTRVISVLMPNTQTVNSHPWEYYRVSVDSIQTLTGYNFLSAVDTSIQMVVEAQVDNGPSSIMAWDFAGANSDISWAATTANNNLDTAGGTERIIRGATASASTGANSFRTTGFKNEGISTANTDYYQVQLKAKTGYTLSLSSIDASFAGTGSYCSTPGVTQQFAYSLDGSTFTLIGSPFVTVGTPVNMSTIDISGVAALQGVASSQPIYLRYYASGQTTTGGWGFYSSDTGNNGLSVNGSLAPVGTIGGTGTVCAGSSTTLTDITPGGLWTSANTGIATIGSATGTVNGVSAGTATISYTVSGSTFTTIVTVNAIATAGSISGAAALCTSTPVTLSDAAAGGVWSSGATGVATVGSTGIVTGIAAGTATISYTVNNGCGSATATKTVTVSATISAGTINGTLTVCSGATTNLTDAATGGNWSSTNTLVATISSAGVVTGVATGTATIFYSVTNGCGTASANKIVTVNAAPSAGTITGTASVCVGLTTALTDAVTGGTWSSGAPGVATVGATGIVTGVAAGTAIISYNIPSTCSGIVSATRIVTVNSLPNAGVITGTGSVCTGSTTQLTDAIAGGTWSTSSAGIGMVGTTGMVSGITPGTTIISYTTINACGSSSATRIVTVNTVPVAGAITGSGIICTGGTSALTDVAADGVWSSSATGVATVAATGVVTGVTAGTATISYVVANTCGSANATTVVTVTAATAGTVSGPSTVLTGATITLTDPVSGGTWSASNSRASVSGAGLVLGLTAGSVNITYSVTGACGTVSSTKTVTVISTVTVTVAAITGYYFYICQGDSRPYFDATVGGEWSISPTSVATISTDGVVTAVSAGTATISYTLGAAYATATVSVYAVPAPITGNALLCVGDTTTLHCATPGGVWSSGIPAKASVTATGFVTSINHSEIPPPIYYTIAGASCRATMILTVNFPPLGISGPNKVCVGSQVTLHNDSTGGTWSGSSSVASVDGSGNVTGLSAGTARISYSNGAGCSKVLSMTVNPTPAPITGTFRVCTGAVAFVSDATTPGTSWSSSTPSVATISGSGGVTGISPGTARITYMIPTACITTAIVTVNQTPAVTAVLGPTSVSRGGPGITLSDLTPGGVWSSSNTAILSVGSSTGLVTANVSAGSAYINYIVTNGGCSNFAYKVISTSPAPQGHGGSATTTPGTQVSVAKDAIAGGEWISSDNSVATVDNNGLVSALATGTVEITHVFTDASGESASTATHVQVNALPMEAQLIPNPNAGAFTIMGSTGSEKDETLEIEITNMLGQIVYSARSVAMSGNVSEQVALSNVLANGMYLLTISGENGKKVFHFVIEK